MPNEAAERLGPEQEDGRGGDQPEHHERDRLGPDGALHLALGDRGLVERVDRVPGQEPHDPALHRRDARRAGAQSQEEGREGLDVVELSGQRRGDEHVRREAVRVVVRHLVGEHDDADERDDGVAGRAIAGWRER